ncbi:hypothetical protein QAD02_022329 [Eretmocerus hayati]|uniref:Uncharacterized protein n=1 Tax=Eretmocerus hayati TaxID=131215 RepID=A0ACC2PXK5_9HYME|nr:hypothetical protein QAD02_022329 [Eretmocerus hayati]
MLIRVGVSNLKFSRVSINIVRYVSLGAESSSIKDDGTDDFKDWKEKLHSTMKVQASFITEEEEKSLLGEVEPYLKRLRYEYAHWDDAIHGYRETEFPKWNEENTKIINKVREKAFPPGMPQLKHVHVLDLAEDGWIKPHVDSTRFCGEVIAALSLLSDSVMRLTYVGHEKDYWDDFFIPRRSLYIMTGVARHKYKHEILCKKESLYKGSTVDKQRRISVICRSEPE